MHRILAFVALVTAFSMPSLASGTEWRVTITLVKGSSCGMSHSTKFMITEKDNVLTLTNMSKRIVHMTIPLQPDGSASGEFLFQLAQQPDRARVTVPAGNGPRRLELLTLKWICSLSVDPA